MLRLASFVLLLTLAPAAHAQLAGTYTIDGSAPTAGTNYQTFADATAALATQGVSAAVTFEVAAGTYTEQVTVPVVTGSSSSRRVTFRGVPDSGDLPRVRATPSVASGAVFRIESPYVTAEFLRFQISNPFQPNGTVVVAAPTATSVRVLDSEIQSVTSSSAGASAFGVLVEGAESRLERLTISGGTHGVAFIAAPGVTFTDQRAWDLTITDPRDRGVYARGQDLPGDQSMSFKRNVVTHLESAPSFVGIEITESDAGSIVHGNQVAIGDGTGIRLAEIDEGGEVTDLASNAVAVTGTGIALDAVSVGALSLEFSTLAVASGADPVLRLDAATDGATARNLILTHRGTGPYFDTALGAAFDFIVYDITGRAQPLDAVWQGTAYTDLATLQAETSTNASSSLHTVAYADLADGDLHLAGPSDGDGRLIGDASGSLPDDIDDEPRSATYPYVGADEAPTALVPPPPSLSGVYTVDPSGGGARNFTGLQEAFDELETTGADGPVTFQVSALSPLIGVTAKYVLRSFAGMGAGAPVRLEPSPGEPTPDLEKVEIRASHVALAGVDVSQYVRLYDQSAFVTIQGGTYTAIELLGSEHVLIADATIDGYVYGSTLGDATNRHVTIRSNTITLGETGTQGRGRNAVYFQTRVDDALIEDNVIFYDQDGGATSRGGINVGGSNGVLRRNRVTETTPPESEPTGGIAITTFSGGEFVVEANVVVSEGHGIKPFGSGQYGAGTMLIANNTVLARKRGIWMQPAPQVTDVVHNTVLVTGSESAFYVLGTTLRTVTRNVFLNVGDGFALEFESGVYASVDELDYNLYSALGPDLIEVVRPSSTFPRVYATLAAFQADTPFEDEGASFFPDLEDPLGGDFHLAGASVGDARLAAPRSPLVPTDLDGDARPDVTYRGADEVAGSPLPPLTVDAVVTVLLQGAYGGAVMRTDLRDADLIPLGQPYGGAPLSYAGAEATTPAVLAAHAVVDWVLVELRATAGGAPVERVAALLLADGSVLAADGAGPPEVSATGDHFVVVWHRNHLAAMTAAAVPLGAADLTAGVFGLGATEVEPGVWALTAGDADGNGSVLADDRQSVWLPAVGAAGYEVADLDLDGSVLAGDRQVYLDPNVGRASQVPGAASLTGGQTEERAIDAARRAPAASRGSE